MIDGIGSVDVTIDKQNAVTLLLLHVDGEGDGQAFTERAASMLCAVFAAAKREGVPCLPYARELIRLGLRGAGARLDQVDPLLCRQLLADSFQDADWESRFLRGGVRKPIGRPAS